MTDAAHPCSGIGWARIPGAQVEGYVRGLAYQALRASRFGRPRPRRAALYRSESTGAHYLAASVDRVFVARPRGPGASFAVRELDVEGLRGPMTALEMTWAAPGRGPGRVLLHEVSLL